MEEAQKQLAGSLVPVVLVGAMGLVEAAVEAAPAAPAAASRGLPSSEGRPMNENSPLVTELMARAGGASVTEAAGAARARARGARRPARAHARSPSRPSVVAVVAIAATSWGLARHDDGKKSASPDAPESSEMTFGPNQPATSPTTTYPTFPEASTPGAHRSVHDADLPDRVRAALPTYSTSRPTRTRAAPTRTTAEHPADVVAHERRRRPTRPGLPTASPTKVTPGAPTATKITRCGTYGRLTVPKTAAVRYDLTAGNGRQGRWVIRASARRATRSRAAPRPGGAATSASTSSAPRSRR